ncbi:carbon-nitrogen hydrolase family protein [Anaerocolumna xylanovorans]|uniref:Carbon-nitrogen hydrolase n=1 Tax=Anaerocolumna xylanovorans DSM 12503 TaxID=1121345 RepID=A0A1M7XYW7_9FIRM|nr:carbon-nitrogen hydrolase family protein [Anaerocolumna xylanovorans]SHO44308.1 Carbon-nitrogen hydrolase [Anaerocolumna xylanovorans DSM 12503]
MIKVSLVVPQKGEDIKELGRFLQEKADIYVFPEGFLETEHLPEALKVIKEAGKYVIAGLRDTRMEESYQTALVIDKGVITGEYKKNILTKSERDKGRVSGESIYCIETKYGKIGIPICYEIHFPEVARIMALESPFMLINLIGTGMYHELQYGQWTTLAKARAIENEVYVLGCSHYAGEIPLAFAFSPRGETIIQKKNEYGSVSLHIDVEESYKREHSYFSDRLPERFTKLCE